MIDEQQRLPARVLAQQLEQGTELGLALYQFEAVQ